MSEPTDQVPQPHDGNPPSAQRRLLMLGALSASAVVTIRPALAATTASVLTCQIPVPDPARSGNWIAADGAVVPPNTAGAFAPPMGPLKAEDVKKALQGRTLPGAGYDASKAYVNYIRNLQQGTTGFTCYASLISPSR